MDLCQSIHNSYFHAMRAQNYICIFSHYSSNIDPKSTENPATWREAHIHDFGSAICCGQNHRQKNTPRGVLSFALTSWSGGWWAAALRPPMRGRCSKTPPPGSEIKVSTRGAGGGHTQLPQERARCRLCLLTQGLRAGWPAFSALYGRRIWVAESH